MFLSVFKLLRFLGFNVTLETKILSRKRPTQRLTHALIYVERYEVTGTPIDSNKFTEFDIKK